MASCLPPCRDGADGAAPGPFGLTIDGIVTAEDVAASVIEGLGKETFLILSHPNVATYMAKKVESYDRGLGGMAKLRRGLVQKWRSQWSGRRNTPRPFCAP